MSKYKAIVTTAGAAKIAAASAGGKQLKITHMAVGDGNGVLPTPNPAQTKLINEKYRALLNTLTIDKSIDNHIIAEFIIPANVGGFWLREMGLYDDAGTLIAVSNMAESYKPKLEEGSGRTQTLRMVLIVSSTEAIQIIAGGDTVLATRDFVDDAIKAHEKTRNHPDASTTAKGLVQLSSATTSNDETKAATPKAVKDVNDASAKKAANLSDLADKAAARGNLALGTAATKNVGVEGGNVMAVGAFGLGMGPRHFDNAYCNSAQIYRVNGTSISAPGNGVYGVLSLPCDGGPSGSYLSIQANGNAFFGWSNIPANGVLWCQVYTTKFKPTAADVGALTDAQAAQKYALRSIKVNGKPLSADVNLVAGDVNAWNKTEADGRFVKQAGDTMTGALVLPRVIFPSEGLQASNADNDLTRPDGFTLEQLGDKSVGYPLTKGNLGNLMTFKLNKYRHVQFVIGSGNTEFWLRSLREDQPATSKAWAQVYTTDYKPTIADVKAADQSNNFAARMGVARVLTGAEKPTSPGVWSVENSSWTPVAWGSLYVTTNGSNLSTASGTGKYIHYLFIAHGSANKFYIAADVNGSFTGWESYLPRNGGNITGPVSSTSWLSAASLTAAYHGVPSGAPPEGSGAFAAQLDTKAPFYQENYDWDVSEGGRYVPLVKGRSNRKGQGYPTAVSFGYLLDGKGSFAKPCIHVRGDNNAEAMWQFDPNNKQFVAPGNLVAGGAVYQNDGNINGSIWGGYLSNWLNNQINGRVDWGSYNRDVGARATIDYVNTRSAVAGGRNAWWYKDEVTGFIIQGGVVNRTDYATRVNFPRGYARECFGVQLTLTNTNGNWFGDSRVNIQARDLDNNGFNAMMDGQEQVVLWQSVGV
ncbi:TPA: phage tail protein [Serratia marcescens]|uniref:phage tail protein n=1 Tax=Serratia marcescens TaxID=615 RepID=UPI0027E58C24|nr:phage tail protein [Serratia marcescens]EIT7186253.1 phage tail protein [Serratia marcescens]EJC6391966.1 phage tail protein [Serratia marcescens]MCX2171266.1 phage tail protein [Serratia marcescens]MCX2175431.1 phage tail protein [Serratia marcescens]HEJ6947794.1 phage tail protein [Serratia marcescens]